MEIWKPVVGFEDAYEISSEGNLRSLDRVIGGPRGDRTWKGRTIKGSTGGAGGYRRAALRRDERKRYVTFHTLVLEAFDRPRPEGMMCRHLDGDPLNNRLDNLRWGTREENAQDSIQHGTHYQTAKEKVCSRGHRVEGANRGKGLSQERYICRACQRARSWAVSHPGTDLDVEADKFYDEIMQGATRIVRKSECLRGHRLSGDNVKVRIRNGKERGECVECSRIRARENYWRKKALR